MNCPSRGVSRRRFVRTAAAGAAAAGFPRIVPASVLGPAAPSRKLVMGAIGVGSMGSGNLNGFLGQEDVRVVAVCDVDAKRLEAARKRVNDRYKNEDCKGYRDYRELLARGDLDAVSIAVPDHWHALTAVAAARAGCDVYGEKPLARSIRESRAIVDAVRRHGRIWQTGSWQRSKDNFYRACELVRNGRIGKILKVEVGLPTGGKTVNFPPAPPPPDLDWNFWLGPAPWRPFCQWSNRAPHYDWRWIMDYSGGQLTDWAGHHIDIAHWGLGFDLTGPVTVEGQGQYAEDGIYDTPGAYTFDCVYANGLPLRVSNSLPSGAKWYGEKGWVHVNRGFLDAEPKSVLREVIGAEEVRLYRSLDHHRNFLDCVKSRKPAITPAEVAHRSISVGLLGEIAMLTGRKLRWNPDTEQIADDPGASALLGRSYREPWILEA